MSEILRLLGIYICIPIYTSIPKLYDIFYYLANAKFFSDGDTTLQQISSNLYVLISVVMLFVFSATLLSAIVNPDMLADKNKGIWAVVKRSFFGIILIVIIPFVFKEAYDIQSQVMEKGLIEKVIVGISFDNSDSTENKKSGGNGGQVIAGRLISAVLYPSADDISATSINTDLAGTYEKMVTTDIERIRALAPDINAVPSDANEDVEYVFEFQGLIAIIAGVVTLYILLLFAIDTAVRIFQLALYELTAPISIIAFIAKGKGALIRWAKQVGSVYLDVFIRIAAMAFYILMISQWDNLITNYKNVSSPESWELLFRVILIVGLLIFVKKIPDIINKAFGTNISLSGGIGGRLGQMALVGKTAQSAWNEIRQHPIQSVGRPVGAAAATIGGIGSSIAGAWARSNRARGLKDGAVNAQAIGAGVAGLFGGLLRTPGSIQRGWKTHNLTSFGNEIARNRDTHPEGSTVGGRISDIVSQTLGLGTALDRENIRIARENRYEYYGSFFTKDQMDRRKNEFEKGKSLTAAMQEALEKAANRADAQGAIMQIDIDYTDQYGVLQKLTANNLNEAKKYIKSMRENTIPDKKDFEIKDAAGNPTGQIDTQKYQDAIKNYYKTFNELDKKIKEKENKIYDDLLQLNDWSGTNKKGDNSDRYVYELNKNVLTELMSNQNFAATITGNDRKLTEDRKGIESMNTIFEKYSNEVNQIIDVTDSKKIAKYTTEQYTQAERDNQAYEERQKKDHQIHGSKGGNYR